MQNDSVNLQTFMNRFKKGSKKFRTIFCMNRSNKIKCKSKTTVKTFMRLISLPVPDEKTLETINCQWQKNHFTMRVRDFIFKFRNNLLGLNTRVSHFNPEVTRGCTFCSLKNVVPVPDEDFAHLFYDCEFVKPSVMRFIDTYLSDLHFTNESEKKNFLFLGVNNKTKQIDNDFLSAIAIMINFHTWECKLQKKVPFFMNLCNDIFYKIENIRRASSRFREYMTNDLHICRIWSAEARARC
jgi:hypothetical protein